MNVGIRTEAVQFLFWEYINWIRYSVLGVKRNERRRIAEQIKSVLPVTD
jgi:hypothetical protein